MISVTISINLSQWQLIIATEAATGAILLKKVFLKISLNSQENTCARVSFLIGTFLAQGFSCEFCKIFKNTFFTEHLQETASVNL